MTRRDFLLSAVAMAGSGFAKDATGVLVGGLRLRVGILSDIHVTSLEDSGWFEKALRWFDASRVDAVLITGDLCTNGHVSEIEAVAATWFKVFPDDRRSDGGKVERLFLTGNHDEDGFAYGSFKTTEEARRGSFRYNRETVWQRLFHEAYHPVSVKTVRGYVFILHNWMSILGDEQFHCLAKGRTNDISPLPELLPKIELPRGRPFFYAQHAPMNDTTNATWLLDGKRWNNGQDKGRTKSVLDGYPNCLAFTGHCHNSLTDERSIWQGGFTAVNCSCLCGFAFTPPGRENGHSIPDFGRKPPYEMGMLDVGKVRQALLMDVFDDEIRIRRFGLYEKLPLGPDWIVSLYGGRTIPASGVPRYDFKTRKVRSRPPRFSDNADISVKRIANGHRRDSGGRSLDPADRCQVVVSFPSITTDNGSPTRGYDFLVRCEERLTAGTRTLCEKRVFSPSVLLAEQCETALCTCAFAGEDVPSDRVVRFTVEPYDCWGNAGTPLRSPWSRIS